MKNPASIAPSGIETFRPPRLRPALLASIAPSGIETQKLLPDQQ